jgi:5-methylcytosine-specific restriction endonuclease McrA
MKYCRYCGTDLPRECFDLRRASKDGLSYKCKQCSRQYNKDRYAEIADRFKARAKQWANANPERRLEIRRASDDRRAHVKNFKNREYARRMRQEDPERMRLAGRLRAKLRKERLLKIEGSASLEELANLLDRAGGFCVYCGRKSRLTIDHFDPVSLGGAGSIENLIPCCKSCNSSKHAKDPVEWLHSRRGVVGLARAVMFLEDQADWATRLES